MAKSSIGPRFWHFRAASQTFFFFIAIAGVLQVAMSGFIYPFFFCPASPAACAGCPLWVIEHGTLEVVGGQENGPLMLVYLAGMFLFIGAAVGRAFCGWACPMGTLQDIFSFFSRKLKSTVSQLVLLTLSLGALLFGTVIPYVLARNDVEVQYYMWTVYVGTIGTFLAAFSGVLLVKGRHGIPASAASLLAGSILWIVPFISDGPMNRSPLGSPELMGALGNMALTISLVGFIYRIGPVGTVGIAPGGRFDRFARLSKFGLLILIPPTTWFFDTLLFTDLDPIGGITATLPELMLSPSSWSANQFFWFKMLFAASVIVSVSLSERFWCKYLCPIGAMYGPTNKFSVTDIEFRDDRCIHCQRCIASCPMRINPKDGKHDMECIRCARCIDACPVKAQRFVPVNSGVRRIFR